MKILRQREIASLENFTVKKKKKIDFAPLEIEASSNEFSSLVSERIRSRGRAVERRSRLSFRGPSSFYATFPTPSLPPQQRCAFPYPDDRGPVSSPSCSGAWWEDERRDRDPLAQIPHTSFFLHLKYHKTGETRW